MRGTLSKVRRQHAERIPPAGAKEFGLTPDGKQLYRTVTPRSRSVPDIDPETGEQRVKRHGVTGEALYRLRKPEIYQHEEIFFLESDGQFNVVKVPYKPPTPEEIAAEERERKIREMGGGRLGAALVDAGLTPEQVLERLAGDAKAVEDEREYPHSTSPGRWLLSDGSTFQGKKVEAEEAEAALARMAASPEL